MNNSASNATPPGSLDGQGAGDHDDPYTGYKMYQFSTSQKARLLLLRGDCLEARLGRGRLVTDVPAAALCREGD